MLSKEYYLIVDCHTYAGNYIRPLGAWLTGYDRHRQCQGEAQDLEENFPEFASTHYDVIEYSFTEHGEEIFNFFEDSSSKLAMKFTKEPTQELLDFLVERINSFQDCHATCELLTREITSSFRSLS